MFTPYIKLIHRSHAGAGLWPARLWLCDSCSNKAKVLVHPILNRWVIGILNYHTGHVCKGGKSETTGCFFFCFFSPSSCMWAFTLTNMPVNNATPEWIQHTHTNACRILRINAQAGNGFRSQNTISTQRDSASLRVPQEGRKKKS